MRLLPRLQRAGGPALPRLRRCGPPRAGFATLPPARGQGDLAFDVLRESPEGLLLQATGAEAVRGGVVAHGGERWLCAFQIGRYWFAAPLSKPAPTAWLGGSPEEPGEGRPEAAAERFRSATPTQAERLPISEGLSTGVLALDTLAPLGVGQSMLLCGPEGSGKSTLAREVLEQALLQRHFARVVRFATDPSSSSAAMASSLPGASALTELAAAPAAAAAPPLEGGDAALLAPLLQALALAEAGRGAGGNALLVLDSVSPLLDAWDLAQSWVEAATGAPVDIELAGAQRRAFFAALIERAGCLQRGGSLTLLALVPAAPPALHGRSVARPDPSKAKDGQEAALRTYSLDDFVGQRPSELRRLQQLVDRGVALTRRNVEVLGIEPPAGGSAAAGAGAAGPPAGAPAGASAPAPPPGAKERSAALRELQSLSDGQVVLDPAGAAAGEHPAIVPGASFSRFGLGAQGPQKFSGRPPALQAVAAHLRTQLALEQEAHFRPPGGGGGGGAGEADGALSSRMQVVRAALLQPPRSPLRVEEMVALLLAACGGALDPLPPDQAARAVRGGAAAPLVAHLREAAPSVLRAISQLERLPESAVRELDVAVRLYVALQQATPPAE